jgi:hypothetical protein
MSTSKTLPSTDLDDKDWIAFRDYVNTNYPKSSFNYEQKEFIKKYLLQDNNGIKCSDMNRLWITFFIDNLLDHLGDVLKHGSVKSLNENMELLKLITVKAMIGFMNDQHILASTIAYKDRNDEQQRMIEIHMNIMNFPLELVIDMGRLFHLESLTSSTSSSATTSTGENQVMFENLHHHLQSMTEQSKSSGKLGKTESVSSISVQPGTEVTTGDETMEEDEDVMEWDPRVSDDTFLRLCVYKVWCDKYEQEEEWSSNKMINEWLKDGISLYNHVSYHWPSCHKKNYNIQNEKVFNAIRHTAIHSWLSNIKSRASTATKVSKPSTNWISDWHTSPVYEKRHEWETYFCHVILTAKNVSKVLHRHSDKLTVETTGAGMTGMDVEGAPKSKKMKTSSGQAAPSPSSVAGKGLTGGETGESTGQMTALEAILDRFDALEKRIHHLEHSNVHLHNEMLRELNGYFIPVKNQLYSLTFGQNFLRSRVDRISK